MKKIILLLVLFFLAGCSSIDSFVMNQTPNPDNFTPEVYDTTNLPENETAVVIAYTIPHERYDTDAIVSNLDGLRRKGLVIVAVDDAAVHGDTGMFSKTYGEYAIRIAPGEHKLLCKTNVGSKMHRTFTINAEKGHTYRLMWKFKQKWPSEIVTFWIEDKETGEVLSR